MAYESYFSYLFTKNVKILSTNTAAYDV